VLTLEDGTGVAGADSFIDLAALAVIEIDYFGAQVASTEPMREAALRRAWVYLKSLHWKVGGFPMLGAPIPDDVKTAQGILARIEIATPNSLQPSVVPGQQKVLTQVGDIHWTVTGSSGVAAQRTVVTMADGLLKPFLVTSGNFLLRA